MPYFKLAPSNLPNCKILGKSKMLKFGTKNVLFGCFWAGIQKQNCYTLNQHRQISLIAKFHEIMKIPKFRTKNILLGYSWPKMSYMCIFRLEFEKNHCHIWNEHLWISLVAKFGAWIKILKFETINVWFGYFWAGIRKCYCYIWNQHT